MKILLKYLRKLLIILLIPPLIYSILVIVGGLIPLNRNSVPNGTIKIYIIQNGSHTDLVFPIKNDIINWENIILPEHFPSVVENARYYSFGWGDKEFYRTTPYWEDLTVGTAFNALFVNTPSAVHIRRLELIDSENVISINIEKEEYLKLSEYILKHLKFDRDQKLVPLNFNYSENDVFYESRSSFHAFRTCNTWTNNALKYSGLRSCLWTPFAWPIFWQYT